MNISVDMSQMYTRVFPFGKKSVSIATCASKAWYDEKDPSNYVAHSNGNEYILAYNSAQTWGLIDSIQTDGTKGDKNSLREWAAAELLKNCTPQISIEVNAVDLANETHVDIDRLKVGKRCRIPLPQYGVAFEDRIISAEWNDLIADPYKITLTIANERRTVQSIVTKDRRKQSKKVKTLERLWLEELQQGGGGTT